MRLSGENYEIIDTTSLYFEYANGSFGYVVYLGGDFPIMQVDTEINNGRKILAIKNSYGNPFVTYLVANYEQVFIVDYRYYEGSLYELILDNGITDVIILTAVMSANHPWHISRTRKVLYGGKTREEILSERDTLTEIFLEDTIIIELHDSIEIVKDTIK